LAGRDNEGVMVFNGPCIVHVRRSWTKHGQEMSQAYTLSPILYRRLLPLMIHVLVFGLAFFPPTLQVDIFNKIDEGK
jgi:hypothetical protein